MRKSEWKSEDGQKDEVATMKCKNCGDSIYLSNKKLKHYCENYPNEHSKKNYCTNPEPNDNIYTAEQL